MTASTARLTAREAEHAARLRRMIERLDQVQEAAFEKGRHGIVFKAVTQISRLIDGEARRLRRSIEELQFPVFPPAFSPDFLTEPPPAPRPGPKPPAPRPSTVAALSDGDGLPDEIRRIMEAELGLPPAAPRPAGSPLTAAGPGGAGGSRRKPPGT